MTFHKKKTPFDISKSKRDTAKIFDKSQGEYWRNKKLIESKIFEDISMYRFRNQKLDEHLKLSPLIPNYYTKVNSKNKIEKVSLILETDNKARKDSKFVIEENMDKLYDNDIREIMYEVDAKGKKNLADRDDPEAMQTAIPGKKIKILYWILIYLNTKNYRSVNYLVLKNTKIDILNELINLFSSY